MTRAASPGPQSLVVDPRHSEVATGERYPSDPRTVTAVREAAAEGKRIAFIGRGASVVAEAGLLDGRSVTAYWEPAEELRKRYPALDLKGDVLYEQDGQVMTSIGSATGTDLCLRIIRMDCGPAAANQLARASGLGTADSLRAHLVRRAGLTPSAYRTQFSRLGTTPDPVPSSPA